MKNIFRFLTAGLILGTAASCSVDNMLPEEPFVPSNEVVVLNLSASPMTKAISSEILESAGPEAYVDFIDIFIFGDQAGSSAESVYYERLSYSTTNPGQKALGAKKSLFVSDKSYDVYVVANSTLSEDDFQDVKSIMDLSSLVQSDEFVHMSGLSGDGLPKNFLMDARAYTDDAKSVAVLNPSDKESENTVLTAELSRAAAKVVVEIFEGSDVEFEDPDNAHVYHYRNLPYNTLLVAGGLLKDDMRQLRSTLPHQINDYVLWDRDATGTIDSGTPNVKVQGYVYEYDFTGEPLDRHTSLVVNIPMKVTKDGKETLYEANYYKIPLNRERFFERNHYYRIKATVKAPGAQSSYEPVVLTDLVYEVLPWDEYQPIISVGNQENKPRYLQLNTNSVKMYNVNEDNSTLTFASSSEIAGIELTGAYYFNKHGVRTEVAADIMNTISATAQPNVLNGNISIYSPIVALTQAEREKLIADLGPAPSAPSVEKPSDPSVSKVDEPNPKDFLPGNGWNVYSYSPDSGPDVKFYSTGMFGYGSTREETGIKREYDAAYAAYQNYQNWLNNPDKDRIMEEYRQKMAEYEAAYAEYNAYQIAVERIEATTSPTHYNTIRYLTFLVTNEQGLTAEFAVEQSPVIFITNSLGWYSYRKDFKDDDAAPTTYEYRGDGIVSVSLTASTSRDGTKSWQNQYSTSLGRGYWFSKARPESYNMTGTLRTQAYGYASNGTGRLQTENASNNSDNLRLYHVHVTTTSGEYVIGRPKMIEITNAHEVGATPLIVTDPSEENSKLVSPSFMIASRLGYFITSSDSNLGDSDMNDELRLEVFRKHCANYVEVHGTNAADRKVYDNWRLPTEAELKIIMDTQGRAGENAAAVDYLLNAVYYFGAHGPVFNSKNDDGITSEGANTINTSSKSVRCVRDEF
ncbi:MAG: hypothetical protein J6A22_00115 [Bacteroidales bacterium]|nr:hypothetical protein [Bacteroidales bacterium]